MRLSNKVWEYLVELVIVFLGVFCAFLLTDHHQDNLQEKEKLEIYRALYEDLNTFYEAGREDNPEGFLVLFKESRKMMDSAIVAKALPAQVNFYGDSWNIEIINSLITSGLMEQADIATFKRISRFSSTHQNMIKFIDLFNNFYVEHITILPNINDQLFEEDGSLKPSYMPIKTYLDIIISHAEILVKLAKERKDQIYSEYLSEDGEPIGN